MKSPLAAVLRWLPSLVLVLAGRGMVLAQCQPVIVGVLDTPGTAYDVAVSNGIAYVADGDAGLQVIDVSDPAAPVERSALGTADSTVGNVDVVGGLAYLGVAQLLQVEEAGTLTRGVLRRLGRRR